MSSAIQRGSVFQRSEIATLTRLAIPVALGELGWMLMSTVDLVMVGPLGNAAIGAIGLSNNLFYTFALMGIGLLFGLDTLVSQAYGAGNREDCRHSLVQGLWLATLIGVPLTALFWLMRPVFTLLAAEPQVSSLAAAYLSMLSLSMLPLAYYAALRRYLQGLHRMRPIMLALVSANLINWLFNWLLIQGHLGFPALGVRGAALSTVLARVYMAGLLASAVLWPYRGGASGAKLIKRGLDWKRIGLLVRLGMLAAAQIGLEIGAFGAAGVLAARLNETALAAHQMALNCASFTYMVPLGVSSAAAVAVGRNVGRQDPAAARRSGYIALALALCFMSVAGASFLLFPAQLLSIYTKDRQTIAVATGLLAIAAAFQLFDGAQVVMTGALRGVGNTRSPMLVNLAGYWGIGLPIGYLLCFPLHFGVQGLWWGLTLALVLIALTLVVMWNRASEKAALLTPTA